MAVKVPQAVLDALTDVAMPRLRPEAPAREAVTVGGVRMPVRRAGCLVVGSGAAGLRAAVELARRRVEVAVLSQSAWGGTSACSGSDKQTLHAANTADRGDDFRAMAAAIGAGGAMDADTAYVEAVGSVRAMASLQYLGLPLPQDAAGGTLRYQTDHDEVGRATSCGPRTSRLMVRVLAEEALRLSVPVFNQTTVLRLIAGGGAVQGVLCSRARERGAGNPMGLAVYLAPVVILAAGGPGELYRDSVYPNGCFGALGLAAEAGLELVNLTESQFGIGTRREGFPWNLSGTYVQALPHIFSQDAAGREHHFLAEFYRSTRELASNVFRKGYQWPFHAGRMLDFGSSLVDLAIWRETARGRRVFMDFNRNPLPVGGDLPFGLARLDDDVRRYLAAAGAAEALPIARLGRMNPLSIELYRRYKIDVAAAPLEFAVNNQHMNGGIAVDVWGQTSLGGVYAVGEAAGTHGVTRPGGAALNAGQVFGTRAAEHVAASGRAVRAAGVPEDALAQALAAVQAVLRADSPLTPRAVRDAVQARMSDAAGPFCDAATVAGALAGARALNAAIRARGIAPGRPSEAGRAVQWQQMALASEAVLTALDHYIAQGGGSRGARAILDAQGDAVPQVAAGPMEAMRFRKERREDGARQIVVRLAGLGQKGLGQAGLGQAGSGFAVTVRDNRAIAATERPFFERDWPAWLTGAIYAGRSF